MELKKLLEGLGVEVRHPGWISVAGDKYTTEYVSAVAKFSLFPPSAKIAAIGARVLLALMDEQEPEWEPGDSFVDGEEGNAQIRAVQNVSAGTIYATDGTRHRVAMCRHAERPKPDLRGQHWEVLYGDDGWWGMSPGQKGKCLRDLRDYLLARK
ncbi:MAG: hypothetical protein KGL39_14285 [Patescibacteria group bacterium]|nr:hypothetical protein [Patescibacteria group bacterium]